MQGQHNKPHRHHGASVPTVRRRTSAETVAHVRHLEAETRRRRQQHAMQFPRATVPAPAVTPQQQLEQQLALQAMSSNNQAMNLPTLLPTPMTASLSQIGIPLPDFPWSALADSNPNDIQTIPGATTAVSEIITDTLLYQQQQQILMELYQLDETLHHDLMPLVDGLQGQMNARQNLCGALNTMVTAADDHLERLHSDIFQLDTPDVFVRHRQLE